MKQSTLKSALQPDTVSAQVVRRVLEKINDQQLRAGDSLESEVQLSRELTVSRGSVREAYRILAALGVVEIGNGRPPRIHPVNAVALSQIFTHALHIAHATPLHVLEFRRGVEVYASQLAARFATEAQLAHLRSLVSEMRASLHDEARRVASDMAIHTTLAEASNNPLNSLVLTALHTAISQSLHQDHTDERSEVEIIRIIDAHEAIVDRVCARDPVGAGAAMSCHFDLSINSLCRNSLPTTLT
jgi:GntR family transcriptional regulator, transcriptional repressor for pyruvate dehydrogenase complex